MADTRVFDAEVGNYLNVVSPSTPVGVCTTCGILRLRAEVHKQEPCPALVITGSWQDAADAGGHSWQGFTDRAELEAYLKGTIAQTRAITQRAGTWLAEQQAAAEAP